MATTCKNPDIPLQSIRSQVQQVHLKSTSLRSQTSSLISLLIYTPHFCKTLTPTPNSPLLARDQQAWLLLQEKPPRFLSQVLWNANVTKLALLSITSRSSVPLLHYFWSILGAINIMFNQQRAWSSHALQNKRQHSFHTPHGPNVQAEAARRVTHSHALQPGDLSHSKTSQVWYYRSTLQRRR